MFAAAESATGAAALAAFSDLLGAATLLPVTAIIDFVAIALGPLTATAKLNGNEAEIRAELAAGKRPEFEVVSEITNVEGKVTGRVRTVWTLKPNRKA
jgi:polyisoprenoid-binding protein YceI